MKVEVIYATEASQDIVELELSESATVQDAVMASGLIGQYPEIELGETPVGIYAERVSYDALLREGDRVEIYRPLLLDPMQARRLRAESQAASKAPKKTNRSS